MKNKSTSVVQIVYFVLIVYVLSAFGYYIWFEYTEIAAFIPILAPTIGYFAVAGSVDTNERVQFRLFSWKECVTGSLLPLLYIVPAVLICALFLGTGMELHNLDLRFILILLAKWIFAGTCEEIGWRGFLLPALSKHMDRQLACFLCGIIWGIWHIPMITRGMMVTQYNVWISIVVFLTETVAITFIMDSMEGRSIWRFVIFHAVHNVGVQIGVRILVDGGKQLVDDGGVVLMICISTVAVLLSIRRKPISAKV